MVDDGTGDGRGGGTPWAYAGAGFETVLPVVLFMWAGRWLDGYLGSDPWCLLTGGLLGIAVGLYNLYKRVVALTQRQDGRRK